MLMMSELVSNPSVRELAFQILRMKALLWKQIRDLELTLDGMGVYEDLDFEECAKAICIGFDLIPAESDVTAFLTILLEAYT